MRCWAQQRHSALSKSLSDPGKDHVPFSQVGLCLAGFPHLIQQGAAAQQPNPGQQSTQACCRDLVLYFHPLLQLKSIGSPPDSRGTCLPSPPKPRCHGCVPASVPEHWLRDTTRVGAAANTLLIPSGKAKQSDVGTVDAGGLTAGGLTGRARGVGWDVPFPLQAAAWRCRHHHRLPQGMPPAEPGRA